ncbi:MAG: lysozyme inhibitor LprI family protein [Massilia sp.]
MRWKPNAAIVLMMFCLSFCARAAEPEQSRCNFNGSQHDINDCAALTFQKADKDMNLLYQRQLKKLGKVNQERLRASQRAWLAYRDKACEYEAGPASTQQSFWIGTDLLCRAKLTAERRDLLEQYTACDSDGGCPH